MEFSASLDDQDSLSSPGSYCPVSQCNNFPAKEVSDLYPHKRGLFKSEIKDYRFVKRIRADCKLR